MSMPSWSMIGSLCSEQGCQESTWTNEIQEDLERRRVSRRHSRLLYDQRLEQNQQLRHEVEQLRAENQALREQNSELREEMSRMERSETRLVATSLEDASKKALSYAAFMLPKFDGSDPENYAEVWLESISTSARTFSWTEDQMLLAAKVALDGSARNWLMGQRRDIFCWKEFKAAFTQRYIK